MTTGPFDLALRLAMWKRLFLCIRSRQVVFVRNLAAKRPRHWAIRAQQASQTFEAAKYINLVITNALVSDHDRITAGPTLSQVRAYTRVISRRKKPHSNDMIHRHSLGPRFLADLCRIKRIVGFHGL